MVYIPRDPDPSDLYTNIHPCKKNSEEIIPEKIKGFLRVGNYKKIPDEKVFIHLMPLHDPGRFEHYSPDYEGEFEETLRKNIFIFFNFSH